MRRSIPAQPQIELGITDTQTCQKTRWRCELDHDVTRKLGMRMEKPREIFEVRILDFHQIFLT
jgi:hypothetical protein